MKLEKVTLNSTPTPSILWSDLATNGLTPIDLFCNGEFLWGNSLLEKAKSYGFYIGAEHGVNGISVDQLLQSADNETIYCIAIEQLIQLSRVQLIGLLCNHNVMICDLSEGGYLIDNWLLSHKNSLCTAVMNEPIKKCYIATSGLDCCDHIEGVSNTFYFPYFMMLATWETLRTNNMPARGVWHNQPQKRALIPVHKPRTHRIKMLHWLDTAGMLDESDWSLTVDFDEAGEYNDFWKTPNVNVERFENVLTNTDCNVFVNKYRSQLPKKLLDNDIETFSQCIALPKQFAGNYNWYVSCETYEQKIFPTEKTYKGFIAGLPVLICGAVYFADALTRHYNLRLPFYKEYDDMGISGSDWSRYDVIADIVKRNPKVDSSVLEHNYDVMNNVEYQLCLVIEQLVNLQEVF